MRITLLTLTLLLAAAAADATVFMTQQQALENSFGAGTSYTRQAFFLTDAQVATARQVSGVADIRPHLVRYVAKRNGQTIGFIYFDAHRVRTLPETVMFVVSNAGVIQKIEIVSFSEPKDYLPKRRWLDQMHGRRLDQELSLKRAIRPISGATLSGRAVVDASRKILALHQMLSEPTPASGAAGASR